MQAMAANPSQMRFGLLEQALLPDPRLRMPLASQGSEWAWHIQNPDGRLEGGVYIDASASDLTHATLNRAGLGAAVVNPGGSPKASLHQGASYITL